jgi:NADH-quinone oxidoreductase subunit J
MWWPVDNLHTLALNMISILFFISLILISLQTNPIYAVFSFILTAFFTFCLLFLLGAEFFALLILIIYIGVITILFLFIVFMYNLRVLNSPSLNYILSVWSLPLMLKVNWASQICYNCLYSCLNQTLVMPLLNNFSVDMFHFIALFNAHIICFLTVGLLIFFALLGSIAITFPFYKTQT